MNLYPDKFIPNSIPHPVFLFYYSDKIFLINQLLTNVPISMPLLF